MGAQSILTEVQPTLLGDDFQFLRDKFSDCTYTGYGEYHDNNHHYFFFAIDGEPIGICTIKLVGNPNNPFYDLSFEVTRKGLEDEGRRVWKILSLQALNYAKQNTLEPVCITIVNQEKARIIKEFFRPLGINFVSNEARVDNTSDLKLEA